MIEDDYGAPLNAVGNADGHFSASEVPAGDYLLRMSGAEAYLVSSDAVDLTRLQPGRSDFQSLQASGANQAALKLTLANLAPWQSTNLFEAVSPGADTWLFQFDGCPGTQLAEGATSMQDALLPFTQNFCGFSHQIDGSKGDCVYLAELDDRTTSAGKQYLTLVRAAPLPVFQLGDGETFTFQGTLADVPQDHTLDCDFRISQFVALTPALPQGFSVPIFSAPIAFLGVIGQGAPLEEGSIPTATSDYLGFADPGPDDVRTAPMSFGIAESDQLTPFGSAGYVQTIQFKFPGTNASGYPGDCIGVTQQYGDFVHMCDAPVVPRLGPPTELAINGQDASHAIQGATTTPVLSWNPPSIGMGRSYDLTLYRYDRVENPPRTRRTSVFLIRTPRTRVRIPPGVLEPGGTYSAYLRATDSSGFVNFMDPVETAYSQASTSTFVP